MITLKNIYYSYPNSSRTVLKNVNMNIPIKNTIGLIGATGSGKTTSVDIILGLLEAQKGTLEVDGKNNIISKIVDLGKNQLDMFHKIYIFPMILLLPTLLLELNRRL